MTQPARKVAFSRPSFGPEEAQAAADAVNSGWVVGGPRLAEFESQFANLCGAKHAVGVSSWTTGAFLVLDTLGIGPGDEVIVPSLTFIASVNVIVHAGATPIFADIDPATLNLDPNDVARKVTARTKAIIPVDQIGLPCEIDQINNIAAEHGLFVLHDAACSFGSQFRGRPIGSLAQVTVFSLHARKVVTTGEGGMIVTNDAELAARLKRQRHQGMTLTDFERHQGSPTTFESYPEVGYNFRITDIQAAIGLQQLRRLDHLLQRRRHVAESYLARLADHPMLTLPRVPQHLVPNWQSFQVSVAPSAPIRRNAIMERLHGEGVATRRGVMATHLEAPYKNIAAHLPHTEKSAADGLQLPIFPDLTGDELDYVIERLWALVETSPN